MNNDVMDVILRCKEEEDTFQFESFSFDDAWKLGSIMMKIAQDNKYPVTMQVCYKEQILFHAAANDVKAFTVNWIRRKHNTVMYSKKSTLHFSKQLIQDGKTVEDLGLSIDDYVQGGGGFPLTVKGEGVVGSIAVSGLKDTADHKIMTDALAEFFGK